MIEEQKIESHWREQNTHVNASNTSMTSSHQRYGTAGSYAKGSYQRRAQGTVSRRTDSVSSRVRHWGGILLQGLISLLLWLKDKLTIYIPVVLAYLSRTVFTQYKQLSAKWLGAYHSHIQGDAADRQTMVRRRLQAIARVTQADLVPLPTTASAFVSFGAGLLLVTTGFTLYIVLSLQILQAELAIEQQKLAYDTIERENAEIVWWTTQRGSLNDIEERALSMDFAPATERHYIALGDIPAMNFEIDAVAENEGITEEIANTSSTEVAPVVDVDDSLVPATPSQASQQSADTQNVFAMQDVSTNLQMGLAPNIDILPSSLLQLQTEPSTYIHNETTIGHRLQRFILDTEERVRLWWD
ncbi:MAG: hypothetical protein AAF639_05395 [Chloroflexota bacterium]